MYLQHERTLCLMAASISSRLSMSAMLTSGFCFMLRSGYHSFPHQLVSHLHSLKEECTETAIAICLCMAMFAVTLSSSINYGVERKNSGLLNIAKKRQCITGISRIFKNY